MTQQADKYILIGAGGHCYTVIDALRANNAEIIGICDNGDIDEKIMDVPVIGNDSMLSDYSCDEVVLACAIVGAPGSNLREKIIPPLEQQGYRFPKIIHPTAYVSSYAEVERGAQIFAGTVIQAAARIEKHAVVNNSANIDHQSVVGTFSHIAPGAILAGNVRVGSGVFVGTGAKILPNITVGDNAIIGAGAVVNRNVPQGAVVYGVPAKERKQ